MELINQKRNSDMRVIMKWFKKMGLGRKLLFGLGIASVLAAIVGYMVISSKGQMAIMTDHIYNRKLLGLSFIKTANVEKACTTIQDGG